MNKKKSGNRPIIIWAVVAVLIVALVATLNGVAVYWDVALTQFFGTVGGSTASSEGGGEGSEDLNYFTADYSVSDLQDKEHELNLQIAGEGAVLLKNDNAALPLAAGAKVSVFGSSATSTLTGGSGSGATAATGTPTVKDVLTTAGLSVNETLWDFYDSGAGKGYGNGAADTLSQASSTWVLNEAPQSIYTADVKSSYSAYSDAAIVVFTRNNGEGADLPRNMAKYAEGTDAEKHYLELTENEKALLTAVQEAGFDRVIVLINSASAMELGFIGDEAYGIDACLQFAGTGVNGLEAIGKIISGEITPSGKTVDTYLYDQLSSPVMQNFGDFKYSGGAEYYVMEAEGIYVGYRYTETRYEDVVLGQGNAGAFDYASEVQFPFGYGLSYAQFSHSGFSATAPDGDGKITVTLTVTNDSDTYSGKDVVEIYAQTPYTDYDKENLVEKSSVQLVGFAKTGILEPGASEEVTITVDLRDMISYDAHGAKTYILDAGTYYITAASDAHQAINNILAAKGCTTENGMTGDGDVSMVSSFERDSLDTTTYSVTAAGATVTNLLGFADITDSTSPWYDADFRYLSRSDWEGTFPVPYGSVDSAASDNATGFQFTGEGDASLISVIQATEYAASGNPEAASSYTMPTLGATNGHEAIELRGLDFDDPLWDEVLDQLTLGELKVFSGKSGYQTAKTESINLPATVNLDGPAGINSFIGDNAGMSWVSAVMLGQTWNVELAAEMGELVGNESIYMGVSGWYAPAMNLHRAPFAGRNFEYYAEDGFLSGRIASAEVAGCQDKGLFVFIKHFALNEQESHREGVCMWSNEQACRELYLKPFQTCIEENASNGTMGVMTSYNRIGPVWTGGCYNLVTGILRNEWGFNGMVLTDYGSSDYMDTDMMLAAGGDAQLRTGISAPTDSESAAALSLLRQSAKHIIYTVVNSNAMNGIAVGTKTTSAFPVYMLILIAVDVVAAAGIGLGTFFVVKKTRKKKTEG